MTDTVQNNSAESRFELEADGKLAYVTYRRTDDVIALLHTQVPRELAGQGVGTKLGRGALDAIRADGLRVAPKCSFIAHLIETHPEYQDMVASASSHRGSD